jgi:hypothetical protein
MIINVKASGLAALPRNQYVTFTRHDHRLMSWLIEDSHDYQRSSARSCWPQNPVSAYLAVPVEHMH